MKQERITQEELLLGTLELLNQQVDEAYWHDHSHCGGDFKEDCQPCFAYEHCRDNLRTLDHIQILRGNIKVREGKSKMEYNKLEGGTDRSTERYDKYQACVKTLESQMGTTPKPELRDCPECKGSGKAMSESEVIYSDEPKPDEGRLLTKTECQAKVERIFQSFSSHDLLQPIPFPDKLLYEPLSTQSWWQSLKKEYGVK